MGIPQLTSCCCGCTLKTGTKIIGWLSMVGAVIMLIMTSTGLVGLYYIEGHPTPDTEKLLPHIQALKTLTMFLIAIHIIGCGLAFMLLLGTYQSKAKLVFMWVTIALTVAVIEQSLSIVEAVFFGQPAKLFNTVIFLVDLYFILVVYSFYREIRNMAEYA